MKKLIPRFMVILPTLMVAISPLPAIAERVQIGDFSGGLNTRMSANQLPSNQASTLLNYLTDEKPGALVTRDGYSLVSSTAAREVFGFRKPNGQEFLIKHYQGELASSRDKGSTWSSMITGLSWERNPLRATVFDKYFIASNKINDVIVFDGFSTTQYDFIPKGEFFISHYYRLFSVCTQQDPNRLYYSKAGADISEEDAWDFTESPFIGFEAIDGNITAVSSFKGQLVLFTEDNIWILIGLNPATWRLSKTDTNYGCVHQESVRMDKGLLLFMSKSGLKAYDGSSVGAVDFQIQDMILDSNNIAGGYDYLMYNQTKDFKIETSTGISVSGNTIKRAEYNLYWSGSDLNGTLSDIEYSGDDITLSTMTAATRTTYEHTAAMNEWNINNFKDLPYLDDGDLTFYASNWNTDWKQGQMGTPLMPTSPPEAPSNPSTLWVSYSQPYDIKEIEIKLGYELLTYYDFLLAGRKSETYNNALAKANGTINSGAVKTWFGYDIYLTLEIDGRVPYKLNQEIDTLDSGSLTVNGAQKVPTDSDGLYQAFVRYTRETVVRPIKTITIPINANQDITGVEIVFKSSFNNFASPTASWFTVAVPLYFEEANFIGYYKLNKIYEATMKYVDSNDVFEPNGTFELAAKSFEDNDDSSTIEFGSVTVYGRWDSSAGTALNFKTKTSTDGVTYTGWSDVTLSTDTLDDYGYASGEIQSSSGTYIIVAGTFTTTVSTNTASISRIDIGGVEKSGEIQLSPLQAADVSGGWNYFIEESDLEGETATFYLQLASSKSGLTGSTYTAISGGTLISSLAEGTTSNTWVQPKIVLSGTNGVSNSEIYNLTMMYIPDQAPVYTSAISIEDRYYLPLSTTSGAAENDAVLVYDKNRSYTLFDIPMRSICELGREHYFSNSGGIYKLNDGTTDAGTAIDTVYEKVFPFDYSYDSRLDNFYVIGQEKTTGGLDAIFKIENSTIEYTASDIDDGTSGNRFRFRQPNGARAEAADWTIRLEADKPSEVNAIELHPVITGEHRP